MICVVMMCGDGAGYSSCLRGLLLGEYWIGITSALAYLQDLIAALSEPCPRALFLRGDEDLHQVNRYMYYELRYSSTVQ